MEIKNVDLRFYISELQSCNLLERNEIAFINYLFDVYTTNESKLEKKDLVLLNTLYEKVQSRKGYKQA